MAFQDGDREMTTLTAWIDMSLKQIHKQVDTCVDLSNLNEIDLMIEQANKLKLAVDSFIGYVERKRKFG